MKPIPNFKNYQIDDTGQVYGKYAKTLAQHLRSGYSAISLLKNGKRQTKYIHRLVLETFISSCPKGMECNHKDGNKLNNNLSNLEWVTRSKNYKHALKLGLINSKGENNPNAKLKTDEVWLIKRILKAKIVTHKYIAKMFKISRQNITLINTKKRWK